MKTSIEFIQGDISQVVVDMTVNAAIGPITHGREKDVEQLAACHLGCLDQAVEQGARSIAFPVISPGYPVAEASVIAVGAVHGWLLNHPDALDRILFVLPDARTLQAYRSAHQARGRRGRPQ